LVSFGIGTLRCWGQSSAVVGATVGLAHWLVELVSQVNGIDVSYATIYIGAVTRPLTGEEPLDQRIQIMMSKSDIAALDDWRFANRVGSRSEAIRQLIAKGLEAEAQPADPLERLKVATQPPAEGVFEGWERQKKAKG
jgi:Arc/MetJ-type ribon-helix-helix transcriptional regulator